MNIYELSRIIAKETGEPAYKVEKILNASLRVIRVQILKAQIIRLKGLFTVFIDVLPESKRFNVAKQEHYIKPRYFSLKVIPSSILKKEIHAKKTY